MFKISPFEFVVRRILFFCLLPSAFYIQLCRAASIVIIPSADTTLSEGWPSNNLGGLAFVNSGTTQNFTTNRALYKFDIVGAIPPKSKITLTQLALEVTKVPVDDPDNHSFFGLYRMLQDWGEGNKTSPPGNPNQGQGAEATTNEATWFYRFAFTNAWALPGGAITNDYISVASASQFVKGTGNSPYFFGPSPQMIEDVQFWLDNPAQNFGWALISSAETIDFTARRFGAREDSINAPLLQIDFIPPPEIISVTRESNQFNLTFAGEAGQTYFVEFRNSLTNGNWGLLTNIGTLSESTNVVVTDSLPLSNPNRFYRVGLQ